MKVLCFFNNDDGTQDREVLEFHVVEEYIDEDGKKQKRGFVYNEKRGAVQIDTALIPRASLLETLALRAILKVTSKSLPKGQIMPLLQEKNDDWS